MSKILDNFFAESDPLADKICEVKMVLSAKIDEAIKQKGWSKQEFAHKIGIQPSVVSKWLSGCHNFTIDTLVQIEFVLDCTIFDLNIYQHDIERKRLFNKFYNG